MFCKSDDTNNTVVFPLVFTVLNIYVIRDGRLFEGGAYLKFSAIGLASYSRFTNKLLNILYYISQTYY